ncbi:hypothetical protein [Lyngbya aestuarii]|uniref:hypothetical protein n=1 Tax=Lyngbya aestuarii TaxID=118322 RepID=UPI00041E1847|nr:hypothetical protein [Lyngbya aestuarii]
MYYPSAKIYSLQLAVKQQQITSNYSHNIRGSLPIGNSNIRLKRSNKRENQQPFIHPQIRQSAPKYSQIHCGSQPGLWIFPVKS